MKFNFPLLALTVGAFGIGTTEFAPMGLLPVVAAHFHVAIPTAGLLISSYAFGVMGGAPLMTIGARHLPRNRVLIGLMAIFTLGNLMSALAPDFAVLVASRMVTALAHGAFFGVGSIVAAALVAPDRRASAVATMFMGLTLAAIVGSPLSTWIGQVVGWRQAFAGIALLGLVAMVALWRALPKMPAETPAEIRSEFGVLVRPQVLRALLTTVLGAGAMFTLLTYIAPVLQQGIGATPGMVTAMLVLIGVGFTVGNGLGGRFADRSLRGTLLCALGLLAGLMLVLPLAMTHVLAAVVAIFLWGMAAFAIVSPVQMQVMTTASEAPNLAASVNIGAFNLGNALGALVGGAVIGAGLDYAWVSVAGAAVALGGFLVVLPGRQDVRQPAMEEAEADALPAN
ncbi:MFS transporter [Gluconacetobacter azotocaptans]|uniref:MFS transporter n=1 Tax=Gluconacetobacter azotocaptans TaxID=142834 RepID=A0A7W4PC76_9PROT|nr:MFS transporter [Gluconacetobacter azotocaptans]MBB2188937.1 MFS transporter [Gluconacetobacter azotocaptans]MBM9401491.1 MFS transporter [Gluconacetobacter azotocaptans]GBQ25959.1 transmembrane efflux protein [Gluconacetobacter azotocaptans DSM 13594]